MRLATTAICMVLGTSPYAAGQSARFVPIGDLLGGGQSMGKAHGVSDDGLVGRLVAVSGGYAKVQLITDRAASVGVMSCPGTC